jgi:hypothetical protein
MILQVSITGTKASSSVDFCQVDEIPRNTMGKVQKNQLLHIFRTLGVELV